MGPGALAVVVCDQAGWHQRAPGVRTRSCALRPASGTAAASATINSAEANDSAL